MQRQKPLGSEYRNVTFVFHVEFPGLGITNFDSCYMFSRNDWRLLFAEDFIFWKFFSWELFAGCVRVVYKNVHKNSRRMSARWFYFTCKLMLNLGLFEDRHPHRLLYSDSPRRIKNAPRHYAALRATTIRSFSLDTRQLAIIMLFCCITALLYMLVTSNY